MIQEVYYNLWKDDTLQKKQKALAGKFIFTELERQYVSIEDNIDCFAKDAHGRLGEIYRYIIIGYGPACWISSNAAWTSFSPTT